MSNVTNCPVKKNSLHNLEAQRHAPDGTSLQYQKPAHLQAQSAAILVPAESCTTIIPCATTTLSPQSAG